MEDKIDKLMRSIRIAQMDPNKGPDTYVEADADVIAHLNPRGLGGASYFTFEGIKVFPTGKGEEILAYEAESPTDRERRMVNEREAAARAAQAEVQASG